jgi:non-specific serine/threonine protein kinase
MALTLGNLGLLAQRAGNLDRARDLLADSLAMARAVGDRRLIAGALDRVASLAVGQSDLPAATASYAERLRLSTDLQDKRGVARALEGCAGLLFAAGRPEPAMELCRLADALLASVGACRSPADQEAFEDLRAQLQRALGPAGSAPVDPDPTDLDLDQIVGRALALLAGKSESPTHRSARPEPNAHPLSRREREIAILVARGLTNRAIAERLVIAERTADTHVSNILGKLGLETRAQIAVWAAERHLIRT